MDCEGVGTHSAAVVDESGQVPTLGGIYNGVVVHSEQVAAADALLRVPLLPVVSHHLGQKAQALVHRSDSKERKKMCVLRQQGGNYGPLGQYTGCDVQ